MRCLFRIACFFLFALPAMSQTDSLTSVNRVHYFNVFQSGMLIGKKDFGTTASFFTVHGIRYKNFSFGIGVGYDDYSRTVISGPYGYETHSRWKVVPFFASLSADFWKIRNSNAFIQLNTGYAAIRGGSNTWQSFTDVKGGVMINPMVGLRMSTGRHRLYISAGYKWQKNQYRIANTNGYWFPETEVRQTLQRFSAAIGFGWH